MSGHCVPPKNCRSALRPGNRGFQNVLQRYADRRRKSGFVRHRPIVRRALLLGLSHVATVGELHLQRMHAALWLAEMARDPAALEATIDDPCLASSDQD